MHLLYFHVTVFECLKGNKKKPFWSLIRCDPGKMCYEFFSFFHFYWSDLFKQPKIINCDKKYFCFHTQKIKHMVQILTRFTKFWKSKQFFTTGRPSFCTQTAPCYYYTDICGRCWLKGLHIMFSVRLYNLFMAVLASHVY